jgi:hypothetical protein
MSIFDLDSFECSLGIEMLVRIRASFAVARGLDIVEGSGHRSRRVV